MRVTLVLSYYLYLAIFGFGGPCVTVASGFGDTKPNILFIICDSLDGRLLTDPERPFESPALDSLVKKGVVFDNTYSNCPICTASRAALWSGRYNNEIKAWSNDKGLDPGYTPTFASMLNQSQYTLFLRGKQDYTTGDHSESGNVMDWTRSVPFVDLSIEPRPVTQLKVGAGEEVETGDWTNANKVAQWLLKDSRKNQPYMAYLGLDIPHPWPTHALNWEHVNVGGDSTFGTSDYYIPKINTSRIKVPTWLPWDQMHPVDIWQSISKNMTGEWTSEQIVQVRQYYYAMCAELDAIVGTVLAALENSGTANNTYVVFTTDHGEMAMEHRQYYKMSAYEASARVPLVITGPGVKPGIVKNLTQLVDVFPTLMDMAGIFPLPPLLNGTSLMPFLNPNAPTSAPPVRPNYILSQYHGGHSNTSWYMIRTGPYKYIAYGDGKSTPPQLFNLVNDPNELKDLRTILPDVVSSLDQLLRELINYPAVTQEVETYNRASYSKWKEQQGDQYSNVLANLIWFWDWARDPVGNVNLIEKWLNAS